MNFVIVYSSRYGNGKKCVDVVTRQLKTKGQGVQVINAQDAGPAELPPADIYIFSAASEKFSLQTWMKKYLKKVPEMPGQKYALISTHAMDRTIGLNKMDKILTKKKMVKVGSIDFKVEGEVNKGLGLPEGYEAKLKSWANGLL